MSETVTLTLVFDEYKPAEVARIADEVSDPNSVRYGQHLQRAELAPLVLLPEEDRHKIVEWAASHGMTVLDTSGTSRQLMFLRAAADNAIAALGGELRRYLSAAERARLSGSRSELAIPRHLAGYVQKVGGLIGDRGQAGCGISGLIACAPEAEAQAAAFFESVGEAPKVVPGAAAPPPGMHGLTPKDLREIYSIPRKWDGSGETIGLLMLGGHLDPKNLNAFWTAHGVPTPDVRVVQVGPQTRRTAHPLESAEAETAVEWVGALAPGARIVVYFVDPMIMGDPWAAFMLAVVGDQVHVPSIASTSWVTPERQYYRTHGHAVFKGLLDQAAALGITVLSAAGDWGPYDGVPRTIRDGRPVSDAPWPHGIFPAVEDRLLAVGGTMITSQDPLTEIAWSGPLPPAFRKTVHFSRLAGSGGFSEDVPIPAWQKPALRPYYPRAAGAPSVVPYGRGFPDVAMAASGPAVQRQPGEPLAMLGYQAVVSGRWLDFIGGTSVGAPIWASILALANQARREKGMGRVGFVNPVLYRLRAAQPSPFREIIAGAADVAMNALNMHGQAVTYHLPGYECVPGWNPVTGLGVPNVTRLIELLADRAALQGDPEGELTV